MKARIKNWSDHQHYKDRRPPWIKLHRALLDDPKWWRLPIASRALAPMLWLLASENDGEVDIDTEFVAFRLRMTASEVEKAINPLVADGWVIPEHDASNPLAVCKQGASPETETETDKEAEKKHCRFEEVWQRYPDKTGKDRAAKAYAAARKDGTSHDDIDAGLTRYLAYVAARRSNGFPGLKYKNGGTWFHQRGWLDEYEVTEAKRKVLFHD